MDFYGVYLWPWLVYLCPYRPLSLSIFVPINHCTYQPLSLSTIVRLTRLISKNKLYIEGAMTLSITTLSIMTLSIKGLYMTLNKNDTQHSNALPLCWMSLCWVSRFIYCFTECLYAECCGTILGYDSSTLTFVRYSQELWLWLSM